MFTGVICLPDVYLMQRVMYARGIVKDAIITEMDFQL